MRNIRIIARLLTSIVLLYYCWIGRTWAVALCLTLVFIKDELTGLLITKIKEEKHE